MEKSQHSPESCVVTIPPRKVSFEHSRTNSNPLFSDEGPVQTTIGFDFQFPEREHECRDESAPSIRRKRALLARRSTSLSLVDLANPTNESNGILPPQHSHGSHGCRLTSVSPGHLHSPVSLSEERYRYLVKTRIDDSKISRMSSWGHFIDMPPEEDNLQRKFETFCSRSEGKHLQGAYVRFPRQGRPPCRSITKTSMHRANSNTRKIDVRKAPSSKTKNKFRLKPKAQQRNFVHSSADQLSTFFSDLHV